MQCAIQLWRVIWAFLRKRCHFLVPLLAHLQVVLHDCLRNRILLLRLVLLVLLQQLLQLLHLPPPMRQHLKPKTMRISPHLAQIRVARIRAENHQPSNVHPRTNSDVLEAVNKIVSFYERTTNPDLATSSSALVIPLASHASRAFEAFIQDVAVVEELGGALTTVERLRRFYGPSSSWVRFLNFNLV